MGQENIQQTVDGVLDGIAKKRRAAMGKAEQPQDNGADSLKREFKEITLKFGKGCAGEEFQGKDGNRYREILIPNPNKDDHRPWQTFVVKANHVHEDRFGKGMWIKLPSEGHTTLRRSVVTGEKPDGRKEWGMEKTKVTNAELKKLVEAYRKRPREKGKKYSVILADPPWRFKVYSKKGMGRSAQNHYATMNIEDIKALPIADIADKDCALFLWVTFPCLLEGLEVIKSWGFTYKTVAFVWVKQNRKSASLFWGMGYWTRSNAELCILATKGRPKRINAGVHQVVVSHIEEHSRKPAEVHQRINQLMGNVPKIELFARRKAEGFDVWGNEVECDIELTGGQKK